MRTATTRYLIPWALVLASQSCAPRPVAQGPAPAPSADGIRSFEVDNPTTCTAVVWGSASGGSVALGSVPPSARRTFVVSASSWVFAYLQPDSWSTCGNYLLRRVRVRQLPLGEGVG